MPIPLLVALIIGQGAAAQPFSTPFDVAEPNRIALTPKLDGTIDPEEWDPLSSAGTTKTYFQWEPGKLHFSAHVPAGEDVVASFDMESNGWLSGKDNLEVRVSNSGGKVSIKTRILDCTGLQGPKWIDVPGLAMSSRATVIESGTSSVYEVTLADCGMGVIDPSANDKLMMRIDSVPSAEAPAPPYLPRVLTPVKLVFQRSAALPNGLYFNAEGTGQASFAGEGIKLRLTFNGTNDLKLQKIEMHSEGFARNDTNQLTVPFPKFDNKKRSYVDYVTQISENASEGFRVLKATLTTADGIPAVMETSYRVGPLVDFEIPRKFIPIKPLDRTLPVAFYAKSNSTKRVSGVVTITMPEPLKLLNGTEHRITISGNRGNDRQRMDLLLPPNVKGTFPIRFLAMLNGKRVEQTQFITIGGL